MDSGPPVPISAHQQAMERELSAVRVQVAAVAAQQAALTEQEFKLRRQEAALERQREQLAAHLDARREQLLALQERLREQRDELKEQRKSQEQEAKELRATWEAGQREVQEALKQAAKERQRLVSLHRRLRRRFHRQWAGERQRLRDLERRATERTADAQAQSEALERQQKALAEERVKFNGEVELGRRKLRDAWTEFRQEKRAWQTQCTADQAGLDQGISKLERVRAELARSEREWSERQRRTQRACAELAREADGLERRVRNLRRKLLDTEQERQRREALLADPRGNANADPVAPATLGTPLQTLPAPATITKATSVGASAKPAEGWTAATALAARMVDSRSHLLELCARIVSVSQKWQLDRQERVHQLNQAVIRLTEREEGLAKREQTLTAVESDLRRRLASAVKAQHYCASWHARLLAEQAVGRAERDAALAKARQREAHAERTTTLLARLRDLWAVRRRGELESLRAERARCLDLQRRYVELCEDALQRTQSLEREARALAVRALTLEEYRLHFIATADNAAKTERRLVRLRRRWDKRFHAAERKLARDTEAFRAARNAFENHAEGLTQLNDDLASREETLRREQAAWEHGQAQSEIDRARLEAAVHSLRLQRDVLEHQVTQSRGEIDSVAKLLIEEDQPDAPPAMRAA